MILLYITMYNYI